MALKTHRRAEAWLALVTAGLVVSGSACAQPSTTTAVPSAPPESSTSSEIPTPGPVPVPPATDEARATGAPSSTGDTLAIGGGPSSAPVSVYGPNFDAPGALLPMVATAVGTSPAEVVTFTITVGASPGTCEGEQWRHSGGLSQLCWVTMPALPGHTDVTAYADVSTSGRVSRTATGSYPVQASGPTAQAPSRAERDRITSCGNATDRVWLTFDDGFPSTAAMHAVVDTLTAQNVKGRFFAVGSWARAHPEMVAEIRRQGHLVEDHTRDHKWLNTLSESELRSQIAEGPQSDAPRLLRPGYGGAAYTDRVLTAAGALDYHVCYWTVDPRDWAKPSAELIISRVMDGDDKTPPVRVGGVVLMHMTGVHTAEALPGLIAAIRAKGLTLDSIRG